MTSYLKLAAKNILRHRTRSLLTMGTMPQSPPPAMLNQLHQQVWSELLQRELLLNAAEQSQVVACEDEIFAEIERIKADHADFDQLLAKRFGSLEDFSVQLKNDMIISKHPPRPGGGRVDAPLSDTALRQPVKTTQTFP